MSDGPGEGGRGWRGGCGVLGAGGGGWAEGKTREGADDSFNLITLLSVLAVYVLTGVLTSCSTLEKRNVSVSAPSLKKAVGCVTSL